MYTSSPEASPGGVDGAPGRFLGTEESSALGSLTVLNGLGVEVVVGEGQKRGFPVQLDAMGYLYYRVQGEWDLKAVQLKWPECGYVEVIRRGQAVYWACSTLQAAASPGGFSAASALTSPASGGYAQQPKVVVPPAAFAGRALDSSSDSRKPPRTPTTTSATSSLHEAWRDFHGYIQAAPHRVGVMCFVGGCAVVLNGIWTVLDPFSALTGPSSLVKYTTACYTVFFGGVTCLTELHPDFAKPVHDHLQKFQDRMHEWAKGLTMLWGRGLFYFFQGTLILASSGISDIVGAVIGLYMIFCGCILVSLSLGHYQSGGSPQENYIRVL